MPTYTKQGTLKALLAALVATFTVLLAGCGLSTDTGEDLGEQSENLCSGVLLAASPASPQPLNTPVTLTASGATCGAGETPEYRFFAINGAGAVIDIRAYAAGNVASWNTTGLPSGSYQLYVYVRAQGSGANYQAIGYGPSYKLGNVCNSVSSVSRTPAPPQAVGTMVSLSSTATCTGGTAEYRYLYQGPADTSYKYINGGTGTFGPAGQTWNTAGLAAGTYSVIVQTRAVGNTSGAEATGYGNYQLGSVCSNAGGSASPASPQAVGTTITLTGTATCSSPQFRFSYRPYGTSSWVAINSSTYGAASQMWNTTGRSNGLYEILVEARQTGNTGSNESSFIMTYTLGNACSAVTLGVTPTSPQSPGVLVGLTGAATCSGGATPEYQFSYQAPGSSVLTTIQAYSASATVNWNTTGLPFGNYTLFVYSRAVGSTSPSEGSAVAYYVLSSASMTQIQAGLGGHVCARVSDGTARCWGENDVGQLGNGSVSPMSTLPVTVAGLTNVAAVATGGYHSCALLGDHTVRCWGQGVDGQLGNGGLSASPTPVVVSGLTDAIAIAAGTNHNCALRTGGAVSCWGDNSYAQTGSPVPTDYGQTKAPAPVPDITGATAVYAGGFHSCALIGGGVQCWGDNSTGQLGNGGVAGTPAHSITPVAVTGLTSGVTSMSAGDSHNCALVSGTVRCWGDNSFGQIGNGAVSATPVTTPALVAGLSGITNVGAGFTFSCARQSNNAVSCWGRNGDGELGKGGGADSPTPVSVSGINSAASLTTGSISGCVLLTNNVARCWGDNTFGQMGNGTSGTDSLSPTTVTFP